MADYDIRTIFEEIELDLIRSMKRNLSRHQKWEKEEKMNWTMWQAEQLRTLEKFKKENKEIFGDRFTKINLAIESFLKENYETAGLEQEKKILEQLAKNKLKSDRATKGLEGFFFSLNKDKMNALIKATTDDFKKAEMAVLRMTNDQYRKIIYKAQVMANSGASTLKQAVDMASKDFLKAGINCIEYKDGRRVNIATYAEMALRTANKRAVLVSEGDARNAYGIHTVRISKYGQCSETCLPWQGKIYVDDVWSGGTKEEAEEKKLPLLSVAMEGGLFHPNCKHRSTTYFYDIMEEMENVDGEIENPLDEQEHRKNRLHIQQQKRLEQGSLDPKNVVEAKARKEQWIEKDEKLSSENNVNEITRKLYLPNWHDVSDLSMENYKKCNEYLDDLNNHMRLFKTEKSVAFNFQTKEESSDIGIAIDQVVLSKETIKLLKQSKPNSIVLMHCHPNESPFGKDDLLKIANFNSIKEIVVECPSGRKYIMRRNNFKQTFFTPLNKQIYFLYDELVNEELSNFSLLKEYIDSKEHVEITSEMLGYWKDLLYNVNVKLADKTGMTFKELK